QFLDGLLRRCVHVPASDFFDFEWILWDFGHAPVDSRVTFNSLEAFVPCSGHYDSERAMPKDRFLDPPPDPPGHVGGWAVEFRGRFGGDSGVILFNFRVDDSDHLCIEIVGRVVTLNALRHCATSFLYGLSGIWMVPCSAVASIASSQMSAATASRAARMDRRGS